MLPIEPLLPQIDQALGEQSCLVLVAPPGAGKTTLVPLHLLKSQWLGKKKIILLEPRRLAARAAAERMASLLGEQVGATVGLRVRLQTKVSKQTRIEVVTEGVFRRIVLDDTELTGIGLVMFDEFHERSLEADMGLALVRDVQQGVREDLKLLVMSATLDGARVAKLLGHCPQVVSEGRSFPVETRYGGRRDGERLEEALLRKLREIAVVETGSVLVFLPGQREILRLAQMLEQVFANSIFDIAPLYGAMDRKAQDLALQPCAKGRRKIVLATSIAETSLTIEGVRVVLDSGFSRVPVYEPAIALTRLETVRVSRSSADQRRGRAGRGAPGVCYRLWEEAATGGLTAFDEPEIRSADLSGLLLDLAVWGVRDPLSLSWLDPPPRPALTQALFLLQMLEALDADGVPTAEGLAMARLPLPPRLACMRVAAEALGLVSLAALMAAILVERGAGGDALDMAERIEVLRRDRSRRGHDVRELARQWGFREDEAIDPTDCGRLLMYAFPDRIAMARGAKGHFLMRTGHGAVMEAHELLARVAFIVIAEVSGSAEGTRIRLAAAVCLDDILQQAHPQTTIETRFDYTSGAVRGQRLQRLDALVLKSQMIAVEDEAAILAALIEGVRAQGVERLPFSKAQLQWLERVESLRRTEGDVWPNVSMSALSEVLEDWLGPHIVGMTRLSQIGPEQIAAGFSQLLPWPLPQKLDKSAPTHFITPAGSEIAIDYGGEEGPALHARVQEFFGLSQHPAIAEGRLPLILHLLSPAHRPLQITRDLPGFWKGSWADVKAQMKGRYPRHPWPDDPATALPTTRAKPRGA